MAPSISVVLLRPLAAALAHDRAALARLMTAADLSAEILADAEARVTAAQFCIAWAEALRLGKDPELALRIAESTSVGAFGIVEYVCRAAPDLKRALEHWVRYLGILDDAVEVALVESGAQVSLRVIRESQAPAPASHELCFALVVKHARALLGDGFRAHAVRFSHPVPESRRAKYRAFFQCDVRFGAAETEMLFDPEVLAAPIQTADPNLLAILLTAAEQKRGQRPQHLPLTDQVRRVLGPALSSDAAQIEAVARQLGTTARTLQRRLRDEGTSFNAVVNDARRELAEAYLGQGMSCAEISFLLGYSEPSAFFRAFKRWTGLTPIERRATLAAT